jgi:inosine-uridine nucleoside N-ribohydrolase
MRRPRDSVLVPALRRSVDGSNFDRMHQPRKPIPIFIDTDTGIDDAVALALAARLEALRVVGIATVHGNVETDRALRNAREVARRAGLRAPIVAGAYAPLTRPARPARETHGPEGLGYVHLAEPPHREPDRSLGLLANAAFHHAPLTLCCLGPLTNLARALEREPVLASSLGPVFVMGGTIGVRGTQTRWSEFNWWSDPEAAARVLAAGLDIHLVPLDVTRRIAVPGEAIDLLRALGEVDDGARFWGDALRFYADFHRSHEVFDGCVINDALAVALVADPSLAGWTTMRLGVSCSSDERRGAIVRDEAAPPIRVATDVNAEAVLRLIARHVFSAWLTPDALVPGAAAAERWLAANPVGDET